jgi:hypothetical protein
VEGKWSVIQSDDGAMESEKWTVSNAHISTVTAFLESLSEPKEKRAPLRSEKDIFAACLEKQIVW